MARKPINSSEWLKKHPMFKNVKDNTPPIPKKETKKQKEKIPNDFEKSLLLEKMSEEKFNRWEKFIEGYLDIKKRMEIDKTLGGLQGMQELTWLMISLKADVLMYYFNSGYFRGMNRDLRIVCEYLDVNKEVIKELQEDVKERCTDILEDSGYDEWL